MEYQDIIQLEFDKGDMLKLCPVSPRHLWMASLPYCPYCNLSPEARAYGLQQAEARERQGLPPAEVPMAAYIARCIENARLHFGDREKYTQEHSPMNSSNSRHELVQLSKATQMLAEAKTLDEVKKILDVAEAARVYARAAKLGLEAYNHAAEVKVRAERKVGEMLAQLEHGKGGRPEKTSNKPLSVSPYREVLKEHSINDMTASRWQQLASLPEQEFEKRIEETRGEAPITTTGLVREATREQIKQKIAKEPSGKYRVIYADPPWKYGDSRDGLAGTTGATAHYPTMTIIELCALPVRDWCDEDAVLFLWVTSPLLFESQSVFRAWGFSYKACFVWDKIKHNLGHYNSVRHEFLLICTRGSCVPDVPKLFDSVQSIERTEHSVKPEEFRQMIDHLYPHGKRLEMFARRSVKGWESYGNEANDALLRETV